MFERLVDPFFRLVGARRQVLIETTIGKARPDWLWRNVIYDAKLGGYIKHAQFERFVQFAVDKETYRVVCVTLGKPAGATVAKMIEYGKAKGVVVPFISLLP